MIPSEADDMLDIEARKLAEHFDSVQILVTWTENNLTYCGKVGAGDWYARQGAAHEFINQDAAQDQAREIAKAMPQEPPDDEWKDREI